MSTTMSIRSSVAPSSIFKETSEIFQDKPFLYNSVRLTVMELRYCDKQIINELVYRWCRCITREVYGSAESVAGPSATAAPESRKILIIDLIGSINLVRFATLMKEDPKRMRMIGIARSCRINCTHITLRSHLKDTRLTKSLKLVVVYQDEFYILKTLPLLKECLQASKCQILFVVPKLDRQERDVLNLTANHQLLRCDFVLNRREIGPAPPGATSESYRSYLNQVYFQRTCSDKTLPERVQAEITDDGLYLPDTYKKLKKGSTSSSLVSAPIKKLKSDYVQEYVNKHA